MPARCPPRMAGRPSSSSATSATASSSIADFSGQGKNYTQFPDRQRLPHLLDDLREPDVRDGSAHLAEPQSLDPTQTAARSRANRRAARAVSQALEKPGTTRRTSRIS